RSKLSFYLALQIPGELCVRQSRDDFVQKSTRDQLLSRQVVDAATLQIEKLFGLNLAGGRAMRTTDIIGKNFKTRHRVGFRVVAQQQVTHLLISVRSVCTRFDLDQARENRACTIV